MPSSFVDFNAYKYAKRALYLCVLAIGLYIWHEPAYPPNGGTWLGYTLGTLAFLLILWLTYYGIRKRRYHSGRSHLKAWLSAHIYFGLSLIILVHLHSGFQFGWNIHTLAYALLMLEVASGLYGVYAYLRYPRLITDNMGEQTLQALLEQIDFIDRQCLDISNNITPQAHTAIQKMVSNTNIGGTAKQQLTRLSTQQSGHDEISELYDQIKKEERNEQLNDIMRTMQFNQAAKPMSQQSKTQQMHKLLDLLAQKKQLVDTAKRDIRYKAHLDIWLYIHVPLTFAVITSVSIHIISVFLYW